MEGRKETAQEVKAERITIWSRIKELLFLVLVFIILRGTVVQAFVIPSSSMEPTLLISDHLLVNKLNYGLRIFGLDEALFTWRLPKREDIIVFTLPDDPATTETDEADIYLIKRVIALPGETVEVRDTTVYIDNQPLKENPNVNWQLAGIKDFGPAVVPPDCVFLLGDNRDHSRDARYWDNHFLNAARIEGRAFVMYWPRVGLL